MNNPLEYVHFDSPVGVLELEAAGQQLTAIRFHHFEKEIDTVSSENKVLKTATTQLREYFNGSRTEFDIPISFKGTAFETNVWKQLQTIPFGSTITYSQLAKQLGDVNKVRAVGLANGRNPLPVIIPCHRVIGVNNNLVGYGGGISNKRWLLQHEGALLL